MFKNMDLYIKQHENLVAEFENVDDDTMSSDLKRLLLKHSTMSFCFQGFDANDYDIRGNLWVLPRNWR